VSAFGGRLGGVGPVVDDAFHDDGGGELLYAGQGGQLLVAEGLVCLQARGGDAEQVVGVAEKPFGVPDLADFREAVFEFGDGRGVFAVHGDLHQDFEAEPDRGRVDDGPVAADYTGTFQFAEPPVARRGAEGDPLRQIGDGEPTFGLQRGKDLPVSRVYYQDYCAMRRFSA
jgi:hypothetical protein